jgi:hypothetical protein
LAGYWESHLSLQRFCDAGETATKLHGFMVPGGGSDLGRETVIYVIAPKVINNPIHNHHRDLLFIIMSSSSG